MKKQTLMPSNKLIVLFFSFLFLASCASYPNKARVHKAQANNLENGIKITAAHLFNKIQQHKISQDNIIDQTLFSNRIIPVVVDPFVDRYSKEEVMVSKQITQTMMQQAQKNKHIELSPLSQASLPNSKYAIRGHFYYDLATNKYRVLSMAVHIPTVEVIATSDILVSQNQLNYQRTAEYRDMPIFPASNTNKTKKSTTIIEPGKKIRGLDFSTQAILNDAAKAYAKNDFVSAKQLYKLASKRANGQTSRAYSGLYISLLRLGKQQEAEQAFERLIELNFSKNNALALKLLFKVDSTDFTGNAFSQKQYTIWIKKIAQLIQKKQACLTVAGHSSRSGSEAYNRQLSQQRSEAVIDKMQVHLPTVKRFTKAVGKGFSENLVGSGTDDARDMLDRRVEFLKGC